MKCRWCGAEITSDKIWHIHQKECELKPKPVEIIEPDDGFESMDFNELKSLATQKGLKYYRSTKKKELIELLRKGVGNNDLGRS